MNRINLNTLYCGAKGNLARSPERAEKIEKALEEAAPIKKDVLDEATVDELTKLFVKYGFEKFGEPFSIEPGDKELILSLLVKKFYENIDLKKHSLVASLILPALEKNKLFQSFIEYLTKGVIG